MCNGKIMAQVDGVGLHMDKMTQVVGTCVLCGVGGYVDMYGEVGGPDIHGRVRGGGCVCGGGHW